MKTERPPLHCTHHVFTAPQTGPSLIVLGAVHGNEICGSLAIRRILEEIDAGELRIQRGRVTFVPIANPLAWTLQKREGERNLNRCLQPTDTPVQYEDHVANWLCPLLAQHEVLLDLHSFHTPGEPFVMLGPENNDGPLEPFKHAVEERALAHCLGIRRFVDGWLDTYASGAARRGDSNPAYGVGTTEYMRSVGGYGLTVECGQHDDPAAVKVAERCIRATLEHLGISDPHNEPFEPITDVEHMRIREVVDKRFDHDTFVRDWESFDRLKKGEVIGTHADGSVALADRDGYILFPNPGARAGKEWYYVAETVAGDSSRIRGL